jgi:hypothetical protein
MSLTRRTALLILIGAVIGFANRPVGAQEKMGDSRVQVTIKAEIVRLDDVEGHVVTHFESKGYNLRLGTWTLNRGTSDLIKSNGTAQGYTKTSYPDGAVSFSKWEGRTTTTMVNGKAVTTSAGTWSLISGTEEWRNREAGGTWKSKAVGDGISFVEWEGEWRPKR